MSSPKFEDVKRRNPGLAALLDRLAGYIRAQTDAGRQFVIPKLAAAELRISDGEAFVLLEMLAQAGLLSRVYNVYCRKNDLLLATVTSIPALEEFHHCDECDRDHDPSEFRVQVAFSVEGDELLRVAA
jgi:hypothetical protein